LASIDKLYFNSSIYKEIFAQSLRNAFVSRTENLLWIRSGLIHDVNIIGNYINEEIFYPKNEVRSESKLTFVAVTATSWIKNNQLLFESISGLIGKVDFILNLVISSFYSDGESMDNLLEIINKTELRNHVNIQINVDDRSRMAEIYQNSDIFISTSYYETFGVALAESISCGCFGISMMNGGSLEVINHGLNGLILSELEILNLELILKEVELSQDLKMICHNSIKSKFGKKAYFEKLKDFYKF
jgi:glycosyltransferase involved in cell wall biosynthesis